MPSPRRTPVRVNYLAYAIALKRIIAGRFTAPDIAQATGFNPNTVYALIRALERVGLITLVGKDPDRTGCKRICAYELVRQGTHQPQESAC